MADTPETLYINASSIAGDVVDGDSALAAYAESRSGPIVPVAADYRAAIVRFQCTNLDLPVFIPKIVPGQTDPNLTVYKIGISITTTSGVVYSAAAAVRHQPRGEYATAPGPLGNTATFQQFRGSKYYWYRDIASVLAIINTAASSAMLTVVASAAADGVDVTHWAQPVLTYAEGSLAWNCPVDVFGTMLPSGPATLNEGTLPGISSAAVGWNGATAELLSGFACRQSAARTAAIASPADRDVILWMVSGANAPPVNWTPPAPLPVGGSGITFSAFPILWLVAPALQGAAILRVAWQPMVNRPMAGESLYLEGFPFTNPGPQTVGSSELNSVWKVAKVVAVSPVFMDIYIWTTATTNMQTGAEVPMSGGSAVPTYQRLLAASSLMAVVPAEWNCTDAWSPVDSLCFTSTMPVQTEVQGAPLVVTSNGGTAPSSNSMVPAFTDIALPLEGGATDYLGKISYTPSAPYRYLQLTSREPLTSINYQLMWRDRYNDGLYPVFFRPGGSVALKLLLERLY